MISVVSLLGLSDLGARSILLLEGICFLKLVGAAGAFTRHLLISRSLTRTSGVFHLFCAGSPGGLHS